MSLYEDFVSLCHSLVARSGFFFSIMHDLIIIFLEVSNVCQWFWHWTTSNSRVIGTGGDRGKFFIMSTEFNKNISDWSHSYTDHKNGIDFFMRLVKWPKIAVKKCQNLIFKVNFQRQKINRIFLKKKFVGEYQFRSTFFVFINFV